MHRGINVSLAPFHYLGKLIPVVDLLERDLLYGSSRDYKTVVISLLHLRESLVVLQEMLFTRMSGDMGCDSHKVNIHLQRSIGERTEKLRLRNGFIGHQVQDRDPYGTYLLIKSPGLFHNEYSLLFENGPRRKIISYPDRHWIASLLF